MSDNRYGKSKLEVSSILEEIVNDLNIMKSKIELLEYKILNIKNKKEEYEILKNISLPIDSFQEDKREIQRQKVNIEECDKINQELKRDYL